MQRAITGYHRDDAGDLVAELACGHGFHMRHRPPMTSRPWTLTDEGRAAMVGTAVACLRCERFEVPAGFVAYKRTPTFTEASVPAGLRAAHTTKAGVWAKIHVEAGCLRYRVESPALAAQTLTPETVGVVIAERPHRVELVGPVRFYVEFYRREEAPPAR
jgi:tellurite methyltransferase